MHAKTLAIMFCVGYISEAHPTDRDIIRQIPTYELLKYGWSDKGHKLIWEYLIWRTIIGMCPRYIQNRLNLKTKLMNVNSADMQKRN